MKAYWAANYTIDILKYLVYAISAPYLLKLLDITLLIEGENEEFVKYLFLIFGINIISFAYVSTFFF